MTYFDIDIYGCRVVLWKLSWQWYPRYRRDAFGVPDARIPLFTWGPLWVEPPWNHGKP